MDDIITVKIQNGFSCEAVQGETILAALIRSGFPVTSPCGGKGLCGNCRFTLHKGTVWLIDAVDAVTSSRKIKKGHSFCACRATAFTDILVSLPEGKVSGWSLSSSQTERKSIKKISFFPRFKKRRMGLGLDIGTTSIQAEFIDLDTGLSMETFSALNDQRSFGSDVMSRIAAAREGKTSELSAVMHRQIGNILRQCKDKWSSSVIEQCNVSGNTTMLHFFAGENPGGMGEASYAPVFLEERHYKGQEFSLPVENITLLPGISAFVGADIVSGLAFIDIMNKKGSALFIDIGTNGEIVAWKENEKRLLCCSAAAGPCFEGAEIPCGMGALPGAINRISLKKEPAFLNWKKFGSLYYTVLGNIKTRGVCGAGLIDAIAAMKQLGVFDENGALKKDFSRDGFPVTLEIYITQNDVRQFQLAKSAIFSGIKLLCKTAATEISDFDMIYIAGGLGFFINLENAVEAGMFPSEFMPKAAVCGNTSLKGVVKSLIDPAFLPRCQEIIKHSQTINLALESSFAEMFTDNLLFK